MSIADIFFLLRKVQWQVIPSDLFYFFDPHRADFLNGECLHLTPGASGTMARLLKRRFNRAQYVN